MKCPAPCWTYMGSSPSPWISYSFINEINACLEEILLQFTKDREITFRKTVSKTRISNKTTNWADVVWVGARDTEQWNYLQEVYCF